MANEPTNFFSDDDIDNTEEVTEEAQEQEVDDTSSTFKIGEDEYSQEELESLVGLGKMAKEAEEKYNTPMDRVYPEYTRSRQELKELKEQLENRVQVGDITPDQASEALKAAEQIGLVTKQSVQDLVRESFSEMYVQQRAVDKLIEDTASMEKEYDGSDGRPKFNQQDMLEWMNREGIADPKKAYKLRYEDQLDAWKEKQLKSPRQANTLDSSTAGSKEPQPVEITNDNVEQLMKEALRG